MNWTLIIACLALVVALFAVVIALLFYFKVKSFIFDCNIRDNYDRKPQDIRTLIEAAVTDSPSISNYIMGKYREAIHANKNRPSSNGEMISTEMYNDIIANVISQVEKRMGLKNCSLNNAHAQHSTNASTQKLYATSYDAANETFYEVNRQPSEQTIFEIILNAQNPNEGLFEVYPNAQEKVAECKDFLEYCCDVEGSGTTMQTIAVGKVTRRSDKWVVASKLKIRFN